MTKAQLPASLPNAAKDSGSRQPIDLPLARVPQGRVHIIAERCKQCDFCVSYCPTNVLAYSEDCNAKGYHYPVVAEGKESGCVLCKFCDLICPELAIFTTDALAEESGADTKARCE